MPAYNRNKINSGILRYPLDAFEEDTDYLRINTVDYKTTTGRTKEQELRGAIAQSGMEGVPGTEAAADPSLGLPDRYMSYRPVYREIKGGYKFDTRSAVRKGRLRNTSETTKKAKSSEGTIFLPIPSNIQDGNSVKYTEGELDGLTAEVLGFVLDQMNPREAINLNNIGTIIADFLKEGTGLITRPDIASHFTRSLAAQAANIPFGGNLTASQLLARQSGNIVNPNMELLFDGVTIRSFKFSFKMTPRGKDEMEHVKSIIRHFKKSMTPSSSGDVYLSTPKVFELSYMKGNKPHPFLHRFKPCALTDCSVNYTGEANYATCQDGTPVSMIMDLGFKELEPIYADDYTDRALEEDEVSDTHPHLGGVGY